jgi:hypothetical protein
VKRDTLLAFGVIAGVMALGAAATPPDQTTSKFGFLFAIKNPECASGNSCRTQFQTRLVLINGDKMHVAVNTPHLYFPRKSEFWEIGITLPKMVSSAQPQASEQANGQEAPQAEASNEPALQLWAAPVGIKPTLPKPLAKEETDPQQEAEDELRSLSISWVGTDYLSVTEQIGEYTTSPLILPIDGVARNDPENPWRPRAPDTVLRKDLESCVDEKSDFNTREFLEGADQAWSITRGKMRWEFAWTFSHSGRALRGYQASCATSVSPPKELVGSDSPGVGWNQVLARVPDARTAFSSPDRSLVLVFTNTQILALKHEGNTLGVPFARVFLTTSEIASGQWAIGEHADAWAEQLTHAKSWSDKAEPTDKR